MTGFAPERREIMDRIKEDLWTWQGLQCGMPWCTNEWTDAAHIDGSGMGGRISTYEIENMVGLCRSCHDTFDGRDLAGRQHMLRQLLAAHVTCNRLRVAKRKMKGGDWPGSRTDPEDESQ